MKENRFRMIKVSSIKKGQRFRSDLGDLQHLVDSIERTGLLQPIVVTPKMELVAGERRLEAYKSLGHVVVPALITQTRNVLQAQFDENAVREPLSFADEMRLADILEPEIKAAAKERQKAGKGPPGKLPEGGDSRTLLAKKLGDKERTFGKKRAIWKEIKSGSPYSLQLQKRVERSSISSAYATLGIYKRRQRLDTLVSQDSKLPTTIKFGDAFELIKKLPSKSVDFTLTSPPFKWREQPDYLPDFYAIVKEIERVTIDHAFIFNSSRNMHGIIETTHPDRTLIWYKQIEQEPFRYEPIFVYSFKTARYNINADIRRDVFPFSPPQPQERLHRDQNPWQLYEELLSFTHSKVVLDPFLGSGTTYKVCKKMGKTCIGFEIDEDLRPAIMAPLVIKKV